MEHGPRLNQNPGSRYSIALLLFFITYAICEIPSNLVSYTETKEYDSAIDRLPDYSTDWCKVVVEFFDHMLGLVRFVYGIRPVLGPSDDSSVTSWYL